MPKPLLAQLTQLKRGKLGIDEEILLDPTVSLIIPQPSINAECNKPQSVPVSASLCTCADVMVATGTLEGGGGGLYELIASALKPFP